MCHRISELIFSCFLPNLIKPAVPLTFKKREIDREASFAARRGLKIDSYGPAEES
jgi:hypothetical protein